MIVPRPSSPCASSEALLDLMPPRLLQQFVEYQLQELELDWEPEHIKAAAELCDYVDMTYGPSQSRSALVRAANQLRAHLSI
jgi:hypothetical protein